MKIIVIGANGMLGTDFVEACREDEEIEVLGYDLPEVDITSLKSVLAVIRPCDWVVNCAAYTDVDGAEKDRDTAFAINAEGVRNIARACLRRRTPLLHISTDYVFSGRRQHPYTELNRPDPINIYGASKLAGEKAIRAEGCRHLIVRTQSLFGRHGPNFVKAIMRRLETGEPLNVVMDQVSSPTYTVHLAAGLMALLPLSKEGLVHLSASGMCSWYDFACAIADYVASDARINPVSTEDFPRPAPRPTYSVLDNWRFRIWTGFEMPSWSEGLKDYLIEEGYMA